MINKKNKLLFISKLAEVPPIGSAKYAPGSIASLFALITGYLFLITLDIILYLLFIIIFIFISYFLCEIHIKKYNKKDPKEIVIDEFAGQFIALLAIIKTDNTSHLLLSLSLSFILFRFFDITKIGPIKKFENLPGGIGIMADDIVAGLCAFVTQCAILTCLNQPLLIKTLME